MKALSVKQPWAWLICAGYKDVENRGWHLASSALREEIREKGFPVHVYVHAGKSIDWNGYNLLLETDSHNHDVIDAMVQHFWRRNNSDPDFGAIIGEVDIIGCATDSKSPWAVAGQYHFLLANPQLYEKPIPCRGQLGFFEPQINTGGEPMKTETKPAIPLAICKLSDSAATCTGPECPQCPKCFPGNPNE